MNPLLVSIGLWLCGLTVAFGNATLIDVLSSGSASVEKKAQACRELGEKGVKDAVPALAALLSDKALGAYARAGLERIPGPSPVAALRAALSSTEGAARDGVIQSLGALRDAESVSLLLPLAGSCSNHDCLRSNPLG